MKPSLNTKKGFTIIEALISVLMLALVIAAVSGLVQRSISSNRFSKEQVVSNYLAGEAIEYVRNIRDSNFIAGRGWLNGLSACLGQTCKVDTVNRTISTCSGASCILKFADNTSTSGYYTYSTSGTTNSTYSRTVELRRVGGNLDEMAIVVTVTGQSGFLSQIPVVVVEYMHNWKQ